MFWRGQANKPEQTATTEPVSVVPPEEAQTNAQTSPAGPDPEKLQAQRAKRRKRRGRALTLAAKAIVALTILGGLWLGTNFFYYTLKFPDPHVLGAEKQTPILRILAADGSLLAERGGAHPYMPLQLLPAHVIDAVVAIEDSRFFSHWGVDPLGLTRAAFVNLRAGRYVQGGSTLTQQLAKNLFLSPERTLTRKVEEMVLALWLEARLSKNDILELYLNRVYFGGGCYGVESAAQRYFGKSARALSVAEAAIIAGLLKAPSRLSPLSNPGLARQRGRIVLARMHRTGALDAEALAAAKAERVRFRRHARQKSSDGTEYAVDYVLERMPSLIDAGYGDLIVETTLDRDLIRRGHAILATAVKTTGAPRGAKQGALVVLDTSGGVRALVGGVDYRKSQFNRAVKARRQPGSTFKPFVFLAALESGLTPDTLTYDLPLTVDGWSPKNANGQFIGELTVREALAKSINTVAVRLAIDAGVDKVAATGRRLGISDDLVADPSLALGTSEVSLLDLVSAYNIFAAGGESVKTHVIRRIRATSGRVLYAHASPRRDRLVRQQHIVAMNDMLNAALETGTGRRATLAAHKAAGKTGTSQDFRDAWFVGYTAHLTAGVWLGNDPARPMKKIAGGGLPARIWRDVMETAHRDLTPLPLPGANGGHRRARSVPAEITDAQRETAPLPPARPSRPDRRIAAQAPQPAASFSGGAWGEGLEAQQPKQDRLAAFIRALPRARAGKPAPTPAIAARPTAAERLVSTQRPVKAPPLPALRPAWLASTAADERSPRTAPQQLAAFDRISEAITLGQPRQTAPIAAAKEILDPQSRQPRPRAPPANPAPTLTPSAGKPRVARSTPNALAHAVRPAQRPLQLQPTRRFVRPGIMSLGRRPLTSDAQLSSSLARIRPSRRFPADPIPASFFVDALSVLPEDDSESAGLVYPATTDRPQVTGFDPEDIRRRLQASP